MALLERNNGKVLFIDNHVAAKLQEMLLKVTRELGHLVTYEEFKQYSELPKPNQYAYYFGSFGNAARRVWKRVKREIAQQEDKSMTDENKTIEDILRAGESAAIPEPPSRKQEIEELMIDFYKSHGHFPTQAECNSPELELPSYTTLSKYLGPKSQWDAILPDELKAAIPESIPKPTSEPTAKPPQADTTTRVDVKEVVAPELHSEPTGAKVEIKITLPDRKEPILISLSI